MILICLLIVVVYKSETLTFNSAKSGDFVEQSLIQKSWFMPYRFYP
jgi:hypothetical protein